MSEYDVRRLHSENAAGAKQSAVHTGLTIAREGATNKEGDSRGAGC
jgi:hypothetical protein